MNTTFTKESLAAWIQELIDVAKADASLPIAYFEGTSNYPICIVGGWHKVFADNTYADAFCMSASRPGNIMSVKITPAGVVDLSATEQSIGKCIDDDETCFPLEWDDKPEIAAEFFIHEWERFMKESGER